MIAEPVIAGEAIHSDLRCHTRAGGYPVRRGFSVEIGVSGYWIVRRSLSSGSPKARPGGGR